MTRTNPGRYLIVILGPTAVGKTSLAIQLAKELRTEILSADSRQFYREMNIGTAKPTAQQLKEVKHHFINSLSVTDEYNVGTFERDALKVLEEIFKAPLFPPKGGSTQDAYSDSPLRGARRALLVGGSGLYINAVCNGFDEVPPADKEVRANITEMYKREGIEYLRNTLKKLDKEYYSKVDLSNPHRLIRAIEVCMLTGKKYSELRKGDSHSGPEGRKTGTRKRSFNILKIGLTLPREELYKRINERVDEMMANGLLDEVKSLAPFRAGAELNALNTVGYKELFKHLEEKNNAQSPFRDLGFVVNLIKQNTRNFAKRQLTWFRKDKDIRWFNPADAEQIIKYVRKLEG